MMDEPEVDFVSRVGGAILLAETQWTPKAGVSKERAMALAAIEAMRAPTRGMIAAGEGHRDGTGHVERYHPHSTEGIFGAMIDAALSRNQNGG